MQVQDKNVVRTAADLEKKYNLGQLIGLRKNVEVTGQTLVKVENELNNMLSSFIINLSDVLDTQSSISLWFYEGIPTTSNEPYTDWQTPADHYGDFYYDQNSGYVYKYTTLGWGLQSDTNLINAMALTNVELDVILDHERQVFFEQPTPPYQSGDWWVLDDGTLMICQLGKPVGETYEKDDFIVSSKYVTTIAVKQNDTIEVLKGQVVTITDTMVSYTDKATGKTTAISGDSITTGSIKSQNYVANTSGTKISLTDGTIDTKNFKLDSQGNMTCNNASVTGGKLQLSGGNYNNPTFINSTEHKNMRLSDTNLSFERYNKDGQFIDNQILFDLQTYEDGAEIRLNRPLSDDYIGTTPVIIMSGRRSRRELDVYGDLLVTGNKNRFVLLNETEGVLLNAYETATPYFGDIGSDKTDENGYCKIKIDKVFLQTIESDDYKVFIQECGEGHLYIEKHEDSFIVKGTPNLDFDWELKAIQKGYKKVRLEKKKIKP